MATARVTVNMQDSDSEALFSIQGTSDTLAEAKAEAQAKVALVTNAVVLSVNESAAGTIGDYPPHADGGDANGSFTLRKGTDRATTRSINIPKVSTDIKVEAAQDGSVDIENDLVTALGDAYRDASGTGGYTVIRGQLHP